MNRTTTYRRLFAALVVLTSLGTDVRAQYIGAGSTLAGDYLRGVGIAAMGMGQYNLYTAQATSINVDTTIRWTEYLAAVAKQQTREYRARIEAEAAQAKEFYKQNRQRLLENPDAHDVLSADALNRLLDQMQDNKISDSTLRATEFRVPMSVDMIRKIPFKLSEKGEKFSMDRLCLKGKATWTVALQDERFLLQKKAYQRALDKALEQAIDGRMQLPTIDGVEVAADDLLRRLDEVVGPSADRLYTEAKQRLNELKATVRMLKTSKVERAIGEIDKYSGTTVGDLLAFMQIHNLRFAAADSPEERKLLPELYASLKEQSDKVAVPGK
jgi:hypothetical protein